MVRPYDDETRREGQGSDLQRLYFFSAATVSTTLPWTTGGSSADSRVRGAFSGGGARFSIQVAVPPGVGPGQMFTVAVPAAAPAAIPVQAAPVPSAPIQGTVVG